MKKKLAIILILISLTICCCIISGGVFIFRNDSLLDANKSKSGQGIDGLNRFQEFEYVLYSPMAYKQTLEIEHVDAAFHGLDPNSNGGHNFIAISFYKKSDMEIKSYYFQRDQKAESECSSAAVLMTSLVVSSPAEPEYHVLDSKLIENKKLFGCKYAMKNEQITEEIYEMGVKEHKDNASSYVYFLDVAYANDINPIELKELHRSIQNFTIISNDKAIILGETI